MEVRGGWFQFVLLWLYFYRSWTLVTVFRDVGRIERRRNVLFSMKTTTQRRTPDEIESAIFSNQKLESKLSAIESYYVSRPWLIAKRIWAVTAAAGRVAWAWKMEDTKKDTPFDAASWRAARLRGEVSLESGSSRGARLRREVAGLGVVFVKLAQTLATRPDVVGEEAAGALESLQDQNRPFDDTLARERIESALKDSPLKIIDLGQGPVAAASIAQVYKARTQHGSEVAIKVRRPGVVQQVALDSIILRRLLALLQAYWQSDSTDYPGILDTVTAGLFRELDFRIEAKIAPIFWTVHFEAAPYLRVPRPGFSEPKEIASVSSRIHVAEWCSGLTLPALPSNGKDKEDNARRDMVAKGLDVCFLQLFETGLLHADLHSGNFIYDQDTKELVLLDFGLVTDLTPEQMDAMAAAVVAVVQQDWNSFLSALRAVGLVPATPKVWIDPATGERADGLGPGTWKACDENEFVKGFVDALSAETCGDTLLSFSEVTARLTRLALSYQFILPPWLLFVVRAVITFDGVAASLDPPLAALDFAAPHAVRRVLAPLTTQGEADLRALLLTNDDDRPRLDVEKFQRLGTDSPLASGGTGLASGGKAFTTVAIDVLLNRVDGRALRRLVADLDPLPLARLVASRTAGLALSPKPLPKWVKENLASAQRMKEPSPSISIPSSAPTTESTIKSKDARFFAPRPTQPRRPPSWRARRVKSVLIARHLPTLLRSPRGMLSLSIISSCLAFITIRLAIVNSPPGQLIRRILLATRRSTSLRLRAFRHEKQRRLVLRQQHNFNTLPLFPRRRRKVVSDYPHDERRVLELAL